MKKVFSLVFLSFCMCRCVTLEHNLLWLNRRISEKIQDGAQQLDLYWANKKYVEEENKTRLTLYNGFSWKEGGEFKYTPHVGLKLHLPNLQKKWQLQVTTYDEDQEERGINKNRTRTTDADKNYGTSLAIFQDLGKVRTEFRPRLEFTDEVETSYLLKFSSDAESGRFTFRPQVQLFARSDDGTGQFAATNLDFSLSEKDLLTFVMEEQYTDGDNTFSTNHGFKFDHEHNEKFSQEYSFIFESNNRLKYHHEKFTFTPSFRHRVYVDALHYSISPSLTFEKARHYKGVAGLNMRLEVIF